MDEPKTCGRGVSLHISPSGIVKILESKFSRCRFLLGRNERKVV